MTYFNGTELRSILLAAGLLLLGAAARLGLGPEPDDFTWTSAERPDGERAASLSTARRLVSEGAAEEELAATPLGPGERLDPNTASAAELRRLPGVGPARAEAIVTERNAAGPFKNPPDMARVSGIGPRTVEALTPHLAFDRRPSVARSALHSLRARDSSRRVDVNRAQITELEQITGIGPALAARIVATRRRVGPFERPEDLLRVPGIGPAILQRIGEQVRF
jgi:competence protein ComEA